MAQTPRCSQCGAPLTKAGDGLCTVCLLKEGLEPPGAMAPEARQIGLFGDYELAEEIARGGRGFELPAAAEVPEPMSQIGRYKLLEKIGEGGLGVVYMAEQQEPIRRRVAVKLIKPGMDSREVIARFEAERQALALMDHPNIARIFDAGTTDSGHPYFAMELVRGVRITEYCDHHNLSTRERLDLFVIVALAVQHAHQKGIIHRDLKPSNILVTVNDGVPVPKIIDFGIAKATEQPLTNRTLFTRFNQLLGTPAYMSPEQAEHSSLDIDIRTDIYSLGVLLYELLTGHTPFDVKELLKAGLEHMVRIIRETEPARPSARLSTLMADDLTAVARQRHTDPPKLIQYVRGDLDWIAMKCLEKDCTRRYDSARGLALDLRRHLDQKPVTARPPSVAYLTQKFCRRNRGKLISAAAIVFMLALSVVVSEWRRRDTSAADAPAAAAALLITAFALAITVVFGIQARVARRQRLAEKRQNAIDKALLIAWTGDLDGTEQAIRETELTGASVAHLQMLRGLLAFHRGENEEAIHQLEHALKLAPDSVTICAMLARARIRLGQFGMADSLIQAAQRYPLRTPEDYLFKGFMEAFWDPERALQTLDEAVRKRPTGIARLIRGQTRTSRAQNTRTMTDVESAVSDATAARILLPDSPLVIALSLRTHLVAASVYEEKHMPELGHNAWRQAADDFSHLQRYTNHHDAMVARAWFVKEASDDWTDLEKLHAGNGKVHDPLLVYFKALGLYRRGQFQEAANALYALNDGTDNRGSIGEWMRGYVLAELPGGFALALTHVRRQWNSKPSLSSGLSLQTTLLLLGCKAEAVQICRQLRQEETTLSAWRTAWYHRLLDYSSELITADELLNSAGESRWNLCEAHYSIALTKIAGGDRAGAREHFRKAVSARVFDFFEYDWSRAFLARMEQDSNWPPWIPQNVEPSRN